MESLVFLNHPDTYIGKYWWCRTKSFIKERTGLSAAKMLLGEA